MTRRAAPDFPRLRRTLIANAPRAREEFYRSKVFGGPSLHFHREALAAANRHDPEAFATAAYAVLTAWGMHRMGPGGSKMREFATFASSIRALWPTILELRRASGPGDLDETGWEDLGRVFLGIDAMASATKLVGNSKVMAHAFPKLVAPVDRQYTLRYVYGSIQIENDPRGEWNVLRTVLSELFHPIVADRRFLQFAKQWMAERRPWDTSELKIVDNALIGSVRLAHGVSSDSV